MNDDEKKTNELINKILVAKGKHAYEETEEVNQNYGSYEKKVILKTVIILAIIPILCIIFKSCSTFLVDDDNDEEGWVIAVAKQEVKNKLKSPSSAEFPWDFDEYTIEKNGDTYTVKSYVDADNSFGAKLRVNYTVKFTKTGSETYIVDSVIVDE